MYGIVLLLTNICQTKHTIHHNRHCVFTLKTKNTFLSSVQVKQVCTAATDAESSSNPLLTERIHATAFCVDATTLDDLTEKEVDLILKYKQMVADQGILICPI